RPAPASPHGAALAAHDGRASALVARRALVPVAPRPAPPDPHVLDRPSLPLPTAPPLLGALDASGAGAAPVCRRHLAVARSGGLRDRLAFEWLALRAARVFPRHGARILVSRGPALSQPAALVALAPVAVPDTGGCAEHSAVGFADVFRSRP